MNRNRYPYPPRHQQQPQQPPPQPPFIVHTPPPRPAYRVRFGWVLLLVIGLGLVLLVGTVGIGLRWEDVLDFADIQDRESFSIGGTKMIRRWDVEALVGGAQQLREPHAAGKVTPTSCYGHSFFAVTPAASQMKLRKLAAFFS